WSGLTSAFTCCGCWGVGHNHKAAAPAASRPKKSTTSTAVMARSRPREEMGLGSAGGVGAKEEVGRAAWARRRVNRSGGTATVEPQVHLTVYPTWSGRMGQSLAQMGHCTDMSALRGGPRTS